MRIQNVRVFIIPIRGECSVFGSNTIYIYYIIYINLHTALRSKTNAISAIYSHRLHMCVSVRNLSFAQQIAYE